MHVHELTGAGESRTRLDVAHSRGFTQLVGRGAEMQSLESALSRAPNHLFGVGVAEVADAKLIREKAKQFV